MTDETKPTVDQQSPTDSAPDKGAEDKLLTQAEVDKIVGARAKESAAAAVKKLLAELGFDKADDLKAVVTTAKEKADAEKSELEKLQERLNKLEADKKAAEDRAAAAEKQRLVDKRDAALERALKDATKPAAVLAWIRSTALADLEATLTEDGAIVDDKLNALVTKAKKELPELFKSIAPGSPSNADGRTPKPDPNKVFGDKPLVRL